MKQFEIYISNYIKFSDPYFFSIIDCDTNEAFGILTLLRINQSKTSIEV